jgi:hypothetical protein
VFVIVHASSCDGEIDASGCLLYNDPSSGEPRITASFQRRVVYKRTDLSERALIDGDNKEDYKSAQKRPY